MTRRTDLYSALRVAAIYLVVAGFWIAFSDQLLLGWIDDPQRLTRWQTIKGWGFVVGSGALIFWLCHRALKRSWRLRRHLYAAFEAIPDPMALTRLEDGRVEFANSAFRELFTGGESAEGMTSLHIGLWANPHDRQKFKKTLERDGVVVNQKASMVTAEGERIPHLFSSRIVPNDSDDRTIISVARDITELEEMEASLREQLSRLRALRDIDMAITASLDIRVTLNVVLDQVTGRLGVDAADILLVEPASRTLTYAAGRGFETDALEHTTLSFGEGYAGKVARNQETLEVLDLWEEPDGLRRSDNLKEEGFVSYMAVPLVSKGETDGVLEIFHRKKLTPDRRWRDFRDALAGQAAIAVDNASLIRDLQESNERLRDAYDETIAGWARALELRDQETQGHTERVTRIALKLAREHGVPDDALVHIRRGALLHDIGKMGIPDEILRKPGPLDDDEWETMEMHPVYAHELLAPIEFLRPALDIPYCHHEKWDGTGYPRGLEGKQIPASARIFAVVDVWDALLSDRPYRDAWSEERALDYLREEAGSHFDPAVVETFLGLHQQIDLEGMRTGGAP